MVYSHNTMAGYNKTVVAVWTMILVATHFQKDMAMPKPAAASHVSPHTHIPPATEKLPLDHIPSHAQDHIPFLDHDVLVTFEDLPLWPGDFAGDLLPTEYDGFVWTNWGQVYDAQLLRESAGNPVPSGFLSADASGPKAVYGGHAGDPMIGSGDGSNFDFQSAYFTSGWKEGATLTVTGYDNGAQVAVQSFNIGTSDSTHVEFTSELCARLPL